MNSTKIIEKINLDELLGKVPLDIRVKLSKQFQNRVFYELYNKSGSDLKAGQMLGISGALFREYRYCIIKTIRLNIVKKVINILGIKYEEFKTNILDFTTRKEQSIKALQETNNHWKELKKDIDLKICLMVKNGKLFFDLKIWLKASNYVERIKKVPAIIDIINLEYQSNLIKIIYHYFNPHKKEKEIFLRIIPNILELDEEVMYFLGLWCGDRFRVGISNNCIELLKFTADFLINKFNQPRSLILGEVLSSEELDKEEWEEHSNLLKKIGATKIRNRVDKRKFVKRKVINYAILLSNNFILWHILECMEHNLETLFRLSNLKKRCAFYAGFFDAEGHANKNHQRFEWHQYLKKHEHIIHPFINYLTIDGFHPVYRNNKWIHIPKNSTKRKIDFELFRNLILPSIKNINKRNDCIDLINGNLVKRQYVVLAYWIYKNPNKNSKEITEAFNQNLNHTRQKISSMVKENLLLKKRDGRKFTYSLTKEGDEWIKSNKELLQYILDQINDFDSWGKQMYTKSTPALKELLQYPLSPLII